MPITAMSHVLELQRDQSREKAVGEATKQFGERRSALGQALRGQQQALALRQSAG